MWCAGTKKSNEIGIVNEHIQHMLRLSISKPRIITDPPKPMIHLKKKLKQCTQQNDEKMLIQKDNQLLLKKMFEIDSRPHKTMLHAHSLTCKSLNKDKRIKNLNKITEENLGMLNRLQKTKSSYSFKKWEVEHQFQQYLSLKVSENSRRIPRVSGFGINSALNLTGLSFTRPGTTSEKCIRPSTAGKVSSASRRRKTIENNKML